jgi:hypothetical protein
MRLGDQFNIKCDTCNGVGLINTMCLTCGKENKLVKKYDPETISFADNSHYVCTSCGVIDHWSGWGCDICNRKGYKDWIDIIRRPNGTEKRT